MHGGCQCVRAMRRSDCVGRARFALRGWRSPAGRVSRAEARAETRLARAQRLTPRKITDDGGLWTLSRLISGGNVVLWGSIDRRTELRSMLSGMAGSLDPMFAVYHRGPISHGANPGAIQAHILNGPGSPIITDFRLPADQDPAGWVPSASVPWRRSTPATADRIPGACRLRTRGRNSTRSSPGRKQPGAESIGREPVRHHEQF